VILAVIFVLLTIITVVGHGIWLMSAAIVGRLSGKSSVLARCANCDSELATGVVVCIVCGVRKPSAIVLELLTDLAATSRQLERLHRSGVIEESSFETLKEQLESERLRLLGRAEAQNGDWKSASSVPPVSTQPVDRTTDISSSEPSDQFE